MNLLSISQSIYLAENIKIFSIIYSFSAINTLFDIFFMKRKCFPMQYTWFVWHHEITILLDKLPNKCTVYHFELFVTPLSIGQGSPLQKNNHLFKPTDSIAHS